MLWAVVALLLVAIVAAAVVLYLVMSGRGEQWSGTGAKDEAALKRTVTAITTETVKVKSSGKTKKETTSTTTSDYPTSGDCEESAFPTTEENFTIVTCDGQWALGGGTNSEGLAVYQWDEGVWQKREPDSRYTTGSGGPCSTNEHIKEHRMAVTAFGRMAYNPDKLTSQHQRSLWLSVSTCRGRVLTKVVWHTIVYPRRQLCTADQPAREHHITACMEKFTVADVNIKPLEDCVLVQINGAETTTASGLVIPDSAKEKPQRTTVIAVSPGYWADDDDRIPMDVKEGDIIIFFRYGGTELKYQGEGYLLLLQRGVLVVIEN